MIKVAKCSGKKLNQNFRSREQHLRLGKMRARRNDGEKKTTYMILLIN